MGGLDRSKAVFDDVTYQQGSTVSGQTRILVRVRPGCSLG